MRYKHAGDRPIDFVGDPHLSHLGIVRPGDVVELGALSERLRRFGLRPLLGGDLGADRVDAEALRETLREREATITTLEASEGALRGRVDALRLRLADARADAKVQREQARAEQLRREQAERERDVMADRLAAPGGEAGRPWLAPEHEAARTAMVNAWRSEADADARPYKAVAWADAWLHHQPDAAIAERWAAHLEGAG